jgi:ATP-dependent Clp protease protease subunit
MNDIGLSQYFPSQISKETKGETIMNELNVLEGIQESTVDRQLPHPALRDFYRDEQERLFWVDTDINENLLELVKMIMRCNKEDKDVPVEKRTPIKVFIDSPGGDITSLWTTIKAIEISKTPVYTICYCTAFSAAADLLASGHKRYALPGTSAMVHSGSCMFGGTMEQAESMKKHFDKLGKKITDYFLAHTKVDNKVFKKKAPNDWYFDEEEMLEYGLIDEIVNNFDEIM